MGTGSGSQRPNGAEFGATLGYNHPSVLLGQRLARLAIASALHAAVALDAIASG